MIYRERFERFENVKRPVLEFGPVPELEPESIAYFLPEPDWNRY